MFGNAAQISHVAIRPPAPAPVELHDWEADDDGPLTALDASVLLAKLDQADEQCVRDGARKLRRHLAQAGLA